MMKQVSEVVTQYHILIGHVLRTLDAGPSVLVRDGACGTRNGIGTCVAPVHPAGTSSNVADAF